MSQPRMSVENQMRLVSTLLELESMRDRSKRDLYARTLREELGRGLLIVRHDESWHDVLSLVTACLRFPGAMWKLVSILRKDHGDTHQIMKLETLVESLTPCPLLEPADRVELEWLLSGVRCTGVAMMYRAAVGPLGPALQADPGNLPAVVQELEEARVPPEGVPPLLVFIEHLAHRTEDPLAASLHRWNERVAEHLRIAPHVLQACCASVAASPQTAEPRSYLTVQLQRDGVDPERYLLSVWLQRDRGASRSVLQDDRRRTLRQIEREVDDLLAADAGDLTVEFILPHDLLGHPVDQWQTGAQGESYPFIQRRLGVEYPVVVRSLERLRDRRVRNRWRQKWEWLRENGHAVDVGAVRWLKQPGQIRPEALMSELMHDAKPVCLVLMFPPGPTAELGGQELAAGLHAGVPVVAWCRDGGDPGVFESEVTRFLSASGLAGLPQLALRLRQEAVRQGQPTDHVGLHLTLLWDDADRLPERDARLAAPA